MRFSSIAASSACDNGGGVEGTKGTYGVVGVELEPLRLTEAMRSQQAMYSLLTQAAIKDRFGMGKGKSPVWVRGVEDTEPVDWATGLADLAEVIVVWVDEYVEILALRLFHLVGLSPVLADVVITLERAAEVECIPGQLDRLCGGLTNQIGDAGVAGDLPFVVDVAYELVVITGG